MHTGQPTWTSRTSSDSTVGYHIQAITSYQQRVDRPVDQANGTTCQHWFHALARLDPDNFVVTVTVLYSLRAGCATVAHTIVACARQAWATTSTTYREWGGNHGRASVR